MESFLLVSGKRKPHIFSKFNLLYTRVFYQAWVQDDCILANYIFILTSCRSIKSPKKERGQDTAILTEQSWSIRDSLYGQKENFFLQNKRWKSWAGIQASSLSERRIRLILLPHGFSHIIIASSFDRPLIRTPSMVPSVFVLTLFQLVWAWSAGAVREWNQFRSIQSDDQCLKNGSILNHCDSFLTNQRLKRPFRHQ